MNVLNSLFARKKPPNETMFILCKACGYLYTSTACTNCDGCSFRVECIRKLNPHNIIREGLCACCQEEVVDVGFFQDDDC